MTGYYQCNIHKERVIKVIFYRKFIAFLAYLKHFQRSFDGSISKENLFSKHCKNRIYVIEMKQ